MTNTVSGEHLPKDLNSWSDSALRAIGLRKSRHRYRNLSVMSSFSWTYSWRGHTWTKKIKNRTDKHMQLKSTQIHSSEVHCKAWEDDGRRQPRASLSATATRNFRTIGGCIRQISDRPDVYYSHASHGLLSSFSGPKLSDVQMSHIRNPETLVCICNCHFPNRLIGHRKNGSRGRCAVHSRDLKSPNGSLWNRRAFLNDQYGNLLFGRYVAEAIALDRHQDVWQ